MPSKCHHNVTRLSVMSRVISMIPYVSPGVWWRTCRFQLSLENALRLHTTEKLNMGDAKT